MIRLDMIFTRCEVRCGTDNKNLGDPQLVVGALLVGLGSVIIVVLLTFHAEARIRKHYSAADPQRRRSDRERYLLYSSSDE